MDKTLYSISKALMDVAANARVVLHQSPAAREALKGKDLGVSQRRLLERIDGVMSLEQLFAASADIIGVHAVLGNLLTSGFVSTEASADAQTPAIAKTSAAAVPAVPMPERAKEAGETTKVDPPVKPATDTIIAASKAAIQPVFAPPVATPVASPAGKPVAAPVAAAESAREPILGVDDKPAPMPPVGAAEEVAKADEKAPGAKLEDKRVEAAKAEAAVVEGPKTDTAKVSPQQSAVTAKSAQSPPPVDTSANQHAPTPAKPSPVTQVTESPTVAKAAPDVSPPPVKSTQPTAASTPFSPTKGAKDEVDAARKLLTFEAKHLLGADAGRLQPRIDACRNIEDIYDLIVKFQQHLVKTGKGDPDIFLDRLTKGLELARKEMRNENRSAA